MRFMGKISRDGVIYLDLSAHLAQYRMGARPLTTPPPAPAPAHDNTAHDDDEEEVEVEEMEHDGVKYLRSSKGIVYDIETSEEIGVWNEETKSIMVD